ncbi:MAG TPA: orotate phosphoribosyltransferase [Alphaproteobacteria bacterium]|nr:orotate phosphoribosyltransferase [Alphaproteobacteria bacterium]
MNDEAVLQHFRETGALLEGHFILSSGLRSPKYLQCARLLMHPERAALLCAELAAKVRAELGPEAVRLVVSPAMGGVVVGYEMGRQLGVPAIFTERVEGRFTLRRGFEIEPGTPVLMVEEVITTGLSSRECIACIRENGGEVVGAACLVDRSGGKADVGVPLVPLLRLDVPAYPADALPPELAAIPAVKPGSRGLK